jgi:hypothetical protein
LASVPRHTRKEQRGTLTDAEVGGLMARSSIERLRSVSAVVVGFVERTSMLWAAS